MNVSSVKNLNGETFSAVQDLSLTNVVQTNSGNWNEISAYELASANYLTAHQDISNLMTKSESANFYPMTGNPSGFLNTLPEEEEVEFEEIDLSSFATSSQISALSGAIDYVSANANEAITAYQNASATYLTAHQAISADEWNNCYDNVNTNSGAWGGSALPISAGPGINLSMVDGVLVISLA